MRQFPDSDMPISFQIEPARRLVAARAHGHLNYAEVTGYYHDLRAHVNFRSYCSEMVDLRDVQGVGITAVEISELARNSIFDPEAKRALVTSSDLVFGLCRMFTAYSSFYGQHKIGVFHEMEEGRRWLGFDDKPSAQSIRIAS